MKLISIYGGRVTGERAKSPVACRRAFIVDCIDFALGCLLLLGGIFGVALFAGWLVTLAGVA